jgi:hypothetical protein
MKLSFAFPMGFPKGFRWSSKQGGASRCSTTIFKMDRCVLVRKRGCASCFPVDYRLRRSSSAASFLISTRYSHLKTCGEPPFDDLAHGVDGIKEDLRLLLGRGDVADVLACVRLLGMKKRVANKEPCPCRSGSRVGRCHHRLLNVLRKRLGRHWFRIVQQQLLSSVPSAKMSRVRSWPIRWREDALLGGLPEKPRRLDGGSIVEAFSTHAACPSSV